MAQQQQQQQQQQQHTPVYNSPIYSQFISNQNKGLLWKLMHEKGTFNGIPEENAKLVKQEFDIKIANISASITITDQLINLNKRAINDMVQDIDKYKMRHNKPDTMTSMYNAGDLAQQRQKVFENEVKRKQNDFEKFSAAPVPKKIDFSDKLDTPLGAEMDKILAEQIALREKQLNMVLEGFPSPATTQTSAPSWVKPISTTNESNGGSFTPLLKIGETINVPIHPVPIHPVPIHPVPIHPVPILRKKVNFSEEPDTYDNNIVLAIEDTVEDVDNMKNIKEMFTEILNKQNQILELLTIYQKYVKI